MNDRQKAAIKLPLLFLILFILSFVLQEATETGNPVYIVPSALVVALLFGYFIYLLIKYRWRGNAPTEEQ